MKPSEHTKDAYRDAGVDIEAGDALVERIRPHVKRTHRSGVMEDIGGFGALFDLKACGYTDPVLVSSTDGVGTKLRIAIDTGKHDTIGQDLVAMCVNDLVVQGAEPLFFLDYFACGKLDVEIAARVVAGIAAACKEAGCALIGGETAEMPGHYATEDYDLAGFTVGAVERANIITGKDIKPGDVVLGLASSGPHSNGYSLIRKIVKDAGLEFDSEAPFTPGKNLGDILLAPTKLYIRPILDVLKSGTVIKGLAHITGGGLLENIPRCLPKGTAVRLDTKAWPLPPVFQWLASAAGLSAAELGRTLNCGIGMTLICAAEDAAQITTALDAAGETVYTIGVVVAGERDVQLDDAAVNWSLPT
ncbi:MAG: phosphoribosylformylglycinamidine cyclo-ligase [Micavibrio sp.]|nr:phosphoribosylformylglycinamidine cyclo-ligase [Micavibrio sp.]